MKLSEAMQPTLETMVSIVWDRFVKLYPKLGKFPVPTVRFNNRLRTTAGWCFDTLRIVELNTKMFSEFPEIYCNVIIPHELAHQVDFDLYGAKHTGHGSSWCKVMRKYGLPPDVYHNLLELRQQAADFESFLNET